MWRFAPIMLFLAACKPPAELPPEYPPLEASSPAASAPGALEAPDAGAEPPPALSAPDAGAPQALVPPDAG